ncbi:MAG: TROVE domain-containing protein [Candidatus Pelethousia sp.]|nr:TROVE domain-containing protein [Candidatus Pelethousia sp.]
MAKFNLRALGKNQTVNREGYAAYRMDDDTKLVTMVLTSAFGEPKYYGNTSGEIISLAEKTDMGFVARLAVYARREMHLRSVAHALCAVVARHGRAYTRPAVAGVIQRADDITEILGAYLSLYGKPIPNGLKKALADALNRFDEYAFSKYKGERNALKMRDVLCLVHPKPKDAAQGALFHKILNGSLETPYTWETRLSHKGNTREVWEELIQSGQVGYMALLRNLRNILMVTPANADLALNRIADREAVLTSKQLPFRFYAAYQALRTAGLCSTKVADALERAVAHSVENMEMLPGKTLLAIDVSGSMDDVLSKNGDMRYCDIARLLAVLSARICEDAVAVAFDTDLYPLAVSTTGGVLAQADAIPINGGGTDIRLPFQWALDHHRYFDRIILLSDNQSNRGCQDDPCQRIADAYRRMVNPHLFVHAIDLQGYGTQQFIGRNTNIIAGWSEKVLPFIQQAEKGLESMTQAIQEYTI